MYMILFVNGVYIGASDIIVFFFSLFVILSESVWILLITEN